MMTENGQRYQSLRIKHYTLAQGFRELSVGTFDPIDKTNVLLSGILNALLALYAPPEEVSPSPDSDSSAP